MSTVRPFARLAFVLAVCVSAPAAGQTPTVVPVMSVTHAAPTVQPGDIVLVTVTADAPLPFLQGSAFGRASTFWPGEAPNSWHGFVAVPLDTAPGTYDVTASVNTGAAPAGVLALAVVERTFETRNLRVAGRFVNPPASEARRIERDTARLAAAFTTVSERMWDGPFVAPVPGRATSSFGRLSVMNGEPRGRHQGADYAARTGTPVRAPNGGRIVLAGELYFSGLTVVVDHGAGLFSVLAHLSRIDVREGQRVSGGAVVGASGATGRVTGPHLHWTVRLGEVSVDPESLMRATAEFTDQSTTIVAREDAR